MTMQKALTCLLAGALTFMTGPVLANTGANTGAKADAPSATIALTFDDLPGITLSPHQAWVDDFTRRLLAGLRRHRIPATGFVNESKFDDLNRPRQIAAVRAWLMAGFDIGNHTASHEPPAVLGAKGYVQDILDGEKITRPMAAKYGRPLRWFRYPYLKTGDSLADKTYIEQWLAAHHYRIAPITLNANDWEFAEPYDDALLHHDLPRARHIRAAYLAYTAHMIGFYRAASHNLFGRDIAYIALMHAHRLNADSIDAIAAILRHAGLKPVSLDKAMADPVYKTPDTYIGADGPDWLDRWSLAAGKPMEWNDADEVPADIAAQYDKVDDDNH